jgi:hypothetical protein
MIVKINLVLLLILSWAADALNKCFLSRIASSSTEKPQEHMRFWQTKVEYLAIVLEQNGFISLERK